MRFNFHFPEAKGTEHDLLGAGDVAEVAALAERSGFDGFSLSDHPAPNREWLQTDGHQTFDPFVGLAFAAAATERIRLLTYLVVAPYRHPLVLAKAATTLDRLSGGRLILGLGAGYLETEYAALGIDYNERNERLDEALDVLLLQSAGEPFSYRGRRFAANDVLALPPPAQKPIPMWIGGNSALTRRRIAAKAHGWMPIIGGPAFSRLARTSTLESLEDAHRQIAEIRVATTQAGRDVSIDVMVPFLTDPTVLTEANRHREALARLEAAGVTWVTVSTPAVSPRVTAEFLEEFGTLYLAGRRN